MNKEILQRLQHEEIEILDKIVDICEKYNIKYFLIAGTLIGAIRHKGFIPWDDDIDIGMLRSEYNRFLDAAKIELKNDEKFILDTYELNDKYWLPFIKIRKKDTVFMQDIQIKYKGNMGIWVDIFPYDNIDNPESVCEKIRFALQRIYSRAICIKSNIPISKNHKIMNLLAKIWSIQSKKRLFIKINKLMTLKNNKDTEYVVNYCGTYGLKRESFLKLKLEMIEKAKFGNNEYCIPKEYDYMLRNTYGEYMQLPPEDKRITHNPIKIKFKDETEIVFESEEI